MGTRADLYRDVLVNLTIVDADTPADASDTDLVRRRYESLYAMLRTEKLVLWPLASDDIPENVVIPLTQILSYLLARAFGQNPAAYAEDFVNSGRALRRQLATPYIPTVHRAEYF